MICLEYKLTWPISAVFTEQRHVYQPLAAIAIGSSQGLKIAMRKASVLPITRLCQTFRAKELKRAALEQAN